MDLHYLEYIIEIANMHSISRAAENLFITQSTLSQYLSRLEAELGVSLFERKRNEMTLTPAGKLYVSTCEEMLQKKRELYNQLSEMGQAKTGSFSVGITPQWGAVAYSHIIGKFYDSYPNVTVKVTEETASPLIRMLQNGELDMAIIPLTGNSSLPLESILLQSEELILAIPAEHAKNLPLQSASEGLPSISASALKGEPMIFSQNQTTIRKLENQCFLLAISRQISFLKSTAIRPALLWLNKRSAALLFHCHALRHPTKLYTHTLFLPFSGMSLLRSEKDSPCIKAKTTLLLCYKSCLRNLLRLI